jgi:hypothetical protein
MRLLNKRNGLGFRRKTEVAWGKFDDTGTVTQNLYRTVQSTATASPGAVGLRVGSLVRL